MSSVARGGTVVSLGITTGPDVTMALLPVFVNELTITRGCHGDAGRFPSAHEIRAGKCKGEKA